MQGTQAGDPALQYTYSDQGGPAMSIDAHSSFRARVWIQRAPAIACAFYCQKYDHSRAFLFIPGRYVHIW